MRVREAFERVGCIQPHRRAGKEHVRGASHYVRDARHQHSWPGIGRAIFRMEVSAPIYTILKRVVEP